MEKVPRREGKFINKKCYLCSIGAGCAGNGGREESKSGEKSTAL
ncbi:hypothetical protein GWI33_012384, partial [Rhynchophorus ferrugineus]